MKACYFRVPGIVIDSLNLVFSSFVISVWASVELKRMTVSLKFSLAHLNKSCGVKVGFSAERWKLAFAASLFKFLPIPSPGPFPCAVAWKCDSVRIPKSFLWCTILMFFMRDGGSDASRSRDDWDFYECAGEKFASIEPHISDTISHPILSLHEFVVKKLSFLLIIV